MALTAKQLAAIEGKFGYQPTAGNGWIQDNEGNFVFRGDDENKSKGPRPGSKEARESAPSADQAWRESWIKDHPEIPFASGTNAPFGINIVGEQRVDPDVEKYWGMSIDEFEKQSMPSGFTRPQFTDPTTGAQIEYTKPNNPDEWSGAYPDYNPFDFMDSYGWLLPLAVAGGGLAYGAYGAGAGTGASVGGTTLSGGAGTGTAATAGTAAGSANLTPFTGLFAEGGNAAYTGLLTGGGVGAEGGVAATALGGGAGISESAYGIGELATESAASAASGFEPTLAETLSGLLPTKDTLMKEAGKTLVSQGISTLLGKKNTPKVGKAPALSPVLGMPLPNSQAVDMARRRSLATQMSRQGRASTMLSGREKLGS